MVAFEKKQGGEGRNAQTQVSQPAEGETAVSGREAPPSILQRVVVLLRTYVDRDEFGGGGALGGFAAGEQVGPRAADGVLEGVGQEGG